MFWFEGFEGFEGCEGFEEFDGFEGFDVPAGLAAVVGLSGKVRHAFLKTFLGLGY